MVAIVESANTTSMTLKGASSSFHGCRASSSPREIKLITILQSLNPNTCISNCAHADKFLHDRKNPGVRLPVLRAFHFGTNYFVQ